MGEANAPYQTDPEPRYRVRLMLGARLCERGVDYMRGQERAFLDWSQVRHALAAEVGEPEGVRTIVFDLVVRAEPPVEVYRLDADPYQGAQEMACAVLRHLGPDRTSASIKSIAVDGMASRSYPDLDSLAAANLETLS